MNKLITWITFEAAKRLSYAMKEPFFLSYTLLASSLVGLVAALTLVAPVPQNALLVLFGAATSTIALLGLSSLALQHGKFGSLLRKTVARRRITVTIHLDDGSKVIVTEEREVRKIGWRPFKRTLRDPWFDDPEDVIRDGENDEQMPSPEWSQRNSWMAFVRVAARIIIDIVLDNIAHRLRG